MNEAQAESILLQIDLIKKRRGTIWEYQNLEMLNEYEARIIARFNVDKLTVQGWFAHATANAFIIDYLGNDWHAIHFELIPVEVGTIWDLRWLS